MEADREKSVSFIMELGTALHGCGTPAQRLESALSATARRLGLEGQFFTVPTQLMAGFDTGSGQITRVCRVEPGEVNLDRLATLDGLAERVGRGDLPIEDGLARVRDIVAAPPLYGNLLPIPAYGAVSATAAHFFGGGAAEMAGAGGVGLLIGVLAWIFGRSQVAGRVFELVAAFLAAVGALALVHSGFTASFMIVALAGLIVLIPGLTITVAMSELVTRNLASGTIRLSAAGLAFLEIAFGVAVAERVTTRLLGPTPSAAVVPLPEWMVVPSLLISAVSLMVLFRAHPRSLPVIALAVAVTYYGSQFGAWLLGPSLGASVGGFLLAAGSNLYARIRNRPAMVPLVPGILLIVPGALGFRSMESLLKSDVLTGVDTAFTMLLVAISLAAGLLLANTVVPPRRPL